MPGQGDRFPSTTLVGDMGLGPAQIARLSAAGKALTKDDLVTLSANGLNSNLKKATLGDVDVIKQAFQPALGATTTAEAGDINCCCTPCCCAAAVIRPVSVA